MILHSHKEMEKNHTVDIPDYQKPLLESSYPSNTVLAENSYISIKIPLKYLDTILTSTVFCFLIVSCSRGTWELMDMYSSYFPIYESFFLSMFIYVVFCLSQHFFKDLILYRSVESLPMKGVCFLMTKTYVVIYYVTSIMHWRAAWMIYGDMEEKLKEAGMALKLWNGNSIVSDTALFLLVTLILICIRGIGNVTSAPMDIDVDTKEETFFIDYTFFKMGERTSLYVLDCLFSILIVGTLVVFVWRGVWQLLDIFIFPTDEILSSWSSLVLGYVIVAIAFLLQPIIRYVCERVTGTVRLLVADLFILFALFGTINVWRGIWNLLNIYFLPDNLELSCWITHWASLIILILCRCSNSLLIRGVYIDAEEPGGKCVVFPCYYLRVIFRKKKLKKLNLTSFSVNDTIKVNLKENEIPSSNNHVNVSTISGTFEDTNGCKQTK